MMVPLAIQTLWVLSGLILLGIVGLGFLGGRFRNGGLALFAAPQAGLLALTVVTLAVYSVLHVRLGLALRIAFPICMVVSAGSLQISGHRPTLKEIALFLLVIVPVSGLFAYANCVASVVMKGPSLLYADGTDRLGYAIVSDWMRYHAPSYKMIYAAVPRGDPAFPYESLPNIMLGAEPRMGAFAFLGMVGAFERVPSSFAFDSACAIALAAGVIGVAAVFASNRWMFIMLALGLSAGHWYDFQRAGYFGKFLAYPAILFTIGLFLLRRDDGDYRPWMIAPLMVASVGSALMLSGYVTALLVLLIGLAAILFDAVYARRLDLQEIAVLGFTAAFAVAASGFLVRPYGGGFPDAPNDTFVVILRALDLEGWAVSWASAPSGDWVLLTLAATATLMAIVLAHRQKNGVALAFLLVPTIFLAGLLIGGFRNTAYQLTGFFYPAILIGLALLISHPRIAGAGAMTIAACVIATGITIGTRLPRAASAVARYTDTAFVVQHSVSLDEFDAIERAATGQVVLISMDAEPDLPIAALAELGRREMQLQWTENSWYFIVGGWRGWTVPRYEKPAALRLVRADHPTAKGALLATRNFALITNEASAP